MYRTPKSIQILTYFSQFLNQVGAVMVNIKKYMYDLLQVQVVDHKLKVVQNSMSSIVFSTHSTYADLKKIESVITGLAKSRQMHRKEASFSQTNSTGRRSRSQQQFSTHSTLNSTPHSSFFKEMRKKNKIDGQKRRNGKDRLGKKGVKWMDTSDYVKQQQDNQKQPQRTQLKLTIQGQLNNLIMKSRLKYKQIAMRNDQCLHLLAEVKKELCTN